MPQQWSGSGVELLDEGLQIKKPRKSRKERRTDFQDLARMVQALSRLTWRDLEIILAVSVHETSEEAGRFLDPRKRSLKSRIAHLYRKKLRGIAEELRSGDPDMAVLRTLLAQVRRVKVNSKLGLFASLEAPRPDVLRLNAAN